MKTLYRWRRKMDIPMLDEHEWQEVHSEIQSAKLRFKGYRDGPPLMMNKDNIDNCDF